MKNCYILHIKFENMYILRPFKEQCISEVVRSVMIFHLSQL